MRAPERVIKFLSLARTKHSFNLFFFFFRLFRLSWVYIIIYPLFGLGSEIHPICKKPCGKAGQEYFHSRRQLQSPTPLRRWAHLPVVLPAHLPLSDGLQLPIELVPELDLDEGFRPEASERLVYVLAGLAVVRVGGGAQGHDRVPVAWNSTLKRVSPALLFGTNTKHALQYV